MRSEATPDGGARPRVVAIGGGHGLSRTLQALCTLDVDITAVVSVADDGGSSGRLREDYDVVPPGDLRVALASLVSDDDVAAALQYRWDGGGLDGHAMGNLLVTALAAVRGRGIADAFARLGELLGACGRVIPCTTTRVELVAEGRDGTVRGQVAIATSSGHTDVTLDPPAPAAEPTAVAAIEAADLLVLGPGSLFTSVLPNLAVPEIAAAITASTAPLLHVANLRQQPAETIGLDLAGHLDAIARALPDRSLDVVVEHDGHEPEAYGPPLRPLASHPHVVAFRRADLLDGSDGHDPQALATVIGELLDA